MKNDKQNIAGRYEDVEACLATPKGAAQDQDDLEGMTQDELIARARTLGRMLKQRVKEVDRLYQEGRNPRGVIEMLQQELRAEREKVVSLQRQLWDERTEVRKLEEEIAELKEKAVPTFGAPIAGMTFPFTLDTAHRDTVELTVTRVDVVNGRHRVHMTADIRLPEAQPQEVPSPVGGPTFVEVRDVPGGVTQLSLDLVTPPTDSVAANTSVDKEELLKHIDVKTTNPDAPPFVDLHTYTASKMFGVSFKEVTADMRNEAKKALFNLLAYEQAGALGDNAPKLTASAADATENYNAQAEKAIRIESDHFHTPESTENMKNTTTVMSTELVPFHGSMLEAGKADDKVWVALRRLCEPLELGFNGQHDKLASQERAPWATTRVMRMVAEDGKIREVFCLELDCVPMWLATLDSSRVAPHLREKIVLFQKEATKALRDHFFKAPKPAPPPTRAEIARMLLIECERAEKLEAEKQVLEHTVDTLVAEVEAVDARNAELEPIAETHKELTDANGLSSMTQVAMSIKEGLQRLYQWLREDGFIQPFPSCLPYQQHIDSGLFDLICVPYQKKDKKGAMVDHVRYVTHATAKGLTVLAARYRQGGTHSRWNKSMKRERKVKSVPTL